MDQIDSPTTNSIFPIIGDIVSWLMIVAVMLALYYGFWWLLKNYLLDPQVKKIYEDEDAQKDTPDKD